MKISVITVCFNEEKNIEATIKSVLRQSDNNYEYIICDGKSSDKTLEIVESYKQAFLEKGIDYKIKSEKDGGIYFGMNNGIDISDGDYAIFINAGDRLHGTNAIRNIINAINNSREQPDVVYGNYNYVERGFYKQVRSDHTQLKEKMSICHQSMLVSTKLLKKEKFDTTLRIAADYDLTLKLFLQEKNFLYVDSIICDFYQGGISTINIKKSSEEHWIVRDRYGIKYDKKRAEKEVSKTSFYCKLKAKIPQFVWTTWCKLKKRGRASELD